MFLSTFEFPSRQDAVRRSTFAVRASHLTDKGFQAATRNGLSERFQDHPELVGVNGAVVVEIHPGESAPRAHTGNPSINQPINQSINHAQKTIYSVVAILLFTQDHQSARGTEREAGGLRTANDLGMEIDEE